MHLAHPLRVALGEVVVDGDDVHALARKGVEIGGKGGDQRLAFTRAHFRDSALVQTDTADYLHVEVLHAQHAPGRLAQRRKSIGQNIVQRFARRQTPLEEFRLPLELIVVHGGVFAVELFHLIRDLV